MATIGWNRRGWSPRTTRRIVLLPCLALLWVAAHAARAEVRIIEGPTPIPDGEARAPGDITLMNDRLAVALAIESAPPYGVPRGALVDAAPRVRGQIGRDRVEYADFIPNNWSAWPNSYRRIEILQRGPEQAVVRIERDWGKVVITTVYTLGRAADHVVIETTMRNEGEAALPELMSGLTLWPNGGYFFAVPGFTGVEQGKADGAVSDRVVAYDEDWFVALHAPYFDHVDSGSRDLFQRHSLAPRESRRFSGWLQLGPSGDLAPVMAAEVARKGQPSGIVRGTVKRSDGGIVRDPIVVVEKQGHAYGWTLGKNGRYELTLPPGQYSLFATARFHSASPPTPVGIEAGKVVTRDFAQVRAPGRVSFSVSDTRSREPLDARIAIVKGHKPVIEFLGRRVFFTELDRKGGIEVSIAPGSYEFMVSAGGSFLGPREIVKAQVRSGRVLALPVRLQRLFTPRSRGWYSADLHHHADQAEGSTPPADLARAQLAAGLDLLFVSDHDSTANLATLDAIARRRGVGFIPGIELSPSWGHFNAYPLPLDARLSVDIGTATAAEIHADARRMGAMVIQANHPLITYGYLTSSAAGVVPGGPSRDFNLLEINAGAPLDDRRVLERLWQHWNAAEPVFLSAGSDTHDVWNEESGRVRAFVNLSGEASGATFAAALRQGRAYVSYGPLIYPSTMFGERLRVKPGQVFTLGFELQSVAGLRKAELVGAGRVVETREFDAATQRQVRADFELTATQSTWFALMVRDRAGRNAYTNPIWIDVSND